MGVRQKPLFILLLLIAYAPTGQAQLFSDYNFRFKTYTTSDGLVHNSVKKCVSDSKGFLWLATENGLSRFDGCQFRNYQHITGDSTSLPVNDLWDIAIDNNNRVYVSYKSGIAVMDPATGRFTQLEYKNAKIKSEAIAWDKKRKILFIFSSSGLLAYHTATKKITETALKIKSPLKLWQLYADNDDYLWALIERKGYYRYDIKKDTAYYYNSYDWPIAMYQDMNGRYYLSTWGSGFQVFNNVASENKKEIYQLPFSEIPGTNYVFDGIAECPSLTGNDILWVATQTNGIGLFSKSQKKFIHHFPGNLFSGNGPGSPFNWSIYAGNDGNLWICGWHGLTKVNTQNQYFQSTLLPELHSGFYNCVTGIIDDPGDKDAAWMAVLGNGIAHYDKAKNKITSRFYFDNLDVRKYYLERWPINFFKDSNEVIWSGTYGGFIKIKKSKPSFIPLSDSGRYCYTVSTYQDSKGFLWQMGECLFQFNPYTEKKISWEISRYDGKKKYYNGICEGPGGLIYIATTDGIFALNTTTSQINRFHINYAPTDKTGWENVKSLIIIDNILYAGTYNGVVACNLTTQNAQVITSENPPRYIGHNAFYKDPQNNLWMYCSNGLFRYNTNSHEILQFTTADGVYAHSNDPAYFFEYNGNTYLGARMAYTRFNPAYISSNNNKPTAYITVASVNDNTSTFITEGRPLHHRQNNISFDFTAIEYNFPEKITFSTMLEGFEGNWSPPAPARNKRYTNLPPGKYTFRVKAFNNNQQEGNIAFLTFRIKTVFWQTVWFKILAELAVSGIVAFLYLKRINQLKKRQQEKNKLQQLQLEQYKQELETEQITNFFSGSLIGKENIHEVLNDVAKNLIGKMGFEDCMIYLWNEDKTKLVQHAGHGIKGAIENTNDKEKYHIPAGRGIVGATVQNKQALLINDTAADKRYISADGMIRLSELCVPVMQDEEVIGAINIEQTEKNYFTKHHVQIVSTIATLMANKIKAIEAGAALNQKKLELTEASKLLAEQEVAMLRSQMNPHFIFNSLNSVQKYIWENKEEDAAEYLASFAKLMRSILENSRHEFISLQKEIEFLKLYIDLEYRRSNNSFNYIIKIDESLDTEKILIPPMLLQPFIENAVWHGLNKKTGKGNLLVHVYRQNGQLVCVVDDDGMGRTASIKNEGGKKSLGISITQQRIERLIDNTSKSASVTIKDKTENGKAAGTEVTVILPLQKTNGDA
jgi:LytS/YehU family sensor histidine kinase/ligand-binding sensor domain-containing protein